MDYQSELKKFQPAHEFFIGIDSDGCVFDTMEVKQKEFFIPNALKYFNLFILEGFKKFITGKYAGSYENSLVSEFKKSLPDIPPWKK